MIILKTMLNPGQFCYKKDLSKDNLLKTVEVSNEVVFFPEETRFGLSVPNFEEFLVFLGIPVLTEGASNYNELGLDTQVAALKTYLVASEINITYPYWNKVYRSIKIQDQSLFKEFSRLEYMFFDSLVNYQSIGDGYFNTKQKLIKGILKRMDEVLAKGLELDKEKIIKKAIEKNPELTHLLSHKHNQTRS